MYSFVTHQRTGSGLLTNLCRASQPDHLKKFCCGELLLPRFNHLDLNRNVWVYNSNIINNIHSAKEDYKEIVKQKIDWLKLYSEEASFKFIPHTFIDDYPEFEENILEILSNQILITVKRNPYEQFLSYAYQESTDWKKCYRVKESEIDVLHIDDFLIRKFSYKWNVDKTFMNKLNIDYVFDYSKLKEQSTDLFKVTKSDLEKFSKDEMLVNYKSLLKDPDEIEYLFWNIFEEMTNDSY